LFPRSGKGFSFFQDQFLAEGAGFFAKPVLENFSSTGCDFSDQWPFFGFFDREPSPGLGSFLGRCAGKGFSKTVFNRFCKLKKFAGSNLRLIITGRPYGWSNRKTGTFYLNKIIQTATNLVVQKKKQLSKFDPQKSPLIRKAIFVTRAGKGFSSLGFLVRPWFFRPRATPLGLENLDSH
jgi:hypothetical protein